MFASRDLLGLPNEDPTAEKKIWWMHNEAMLAVLYALRLDGDPRLNLWFERLNDWTWAHFPDPEYGEWYPFLDRTGQPTHRQKGSHIKSFFHLPRALYVGMQQLEMLSSTE